MRQGFYAIYASHMITTLFFLQLIGFHLWYITSKQVKLAQAPRYLTGILKNKPKFRAMGLFLMLLATLLFVGKWGLMTGLCASLVGLMGLGCLVVLVQPFQYIQEKGLIAIYLIFLSLELFV